MSTKHPVSLISLDKVQPQQVRWLWPGRIPLGKITILQGDPGLGKSTITLDVAARMTRLTAMPDGSRSELSAPGNVLLLGGEDGVADTVRPRLDALNADQSRVTVTTGEHEHLSIPSQADLICRAVEQCGARLLVIDPLAAFLDPHINSWSNQQVRLALSPLKELAERCGVTVLCVDHLNKRSGISAVHRGQGSMGFAAAARSVLMVGKNPQDPEMFVLAGVKINLCARPASLAYKTQAASNGAVTIEWLGKCDLTADDLGGLAGDTAASNKLQEAEEFIKLRLRSGSVLAKVLESEAAQNGITKRTLARARAKLRIVTKPAGFGGEWMLSLPLREMLAAQRMPSSPEAAS